MHSVTRKSRRARRFPAVEQPEIALFLSQDERQQFEDLRELRTKAAHLGGGSLAAFTAVYVSLIIVVLPILTTTILDNAGPYAAAAPYLTAVVIGGAGLWIAIAFLHEQHDMARAAARLSFYTEALTIRAGERSNHKSGSTAVDAT